jgi:hypothetical protein
MQDFIAYHGMQGRRPRGFLFGSLATHPEGIHLGTLSQARMRAGAGSVLKVRVRASAISASPSRVKDRDESWRDTVKRQYRRGQKILVYLNRHEGLPVDRVLELCKFPKSRILGMPDRQFRKAAPEAEDSWIILDPDLLEVLGTVPKATRASQPAHA